MKITACHNCGKLLDNGEKFCSDKCKKSYKPRRFRTSHRPTKVHESKKYSRKEKHKNG